jgi:hypothetical protein
MSSEGKNGENVLPQAAPVPSVSSEKYGLGYPELAESTAISGFNLVRVKDVAAILGVSQRTVWRMIAGGQLRRGHVRGCTCIPLAEVVRVSKAAVTV